MGAFFKKNKKFLLDIFYSLLAFGIILSVWEITAIVEDKPILMPKLNQVFEKLREIAAAPSFWNTVGATLLRTLETFVLAFAFAIIFAVTGVLFNPLHRVMSPIITVLRAAPTMAIILLSTLWLKSSESPILIGFLIAFPLLYSSVYSALSSVDKNLIEMARVFNVSKTDRIISIYFPSVLPQILDSSKSVISLSVKIIIASEVLAQTKTSIGVEMMRSNLVFDIGTLIAWTAIAIVLSFLLEIITLAIKKLLGMKYGY